LASQQIWTPHEVDMEGYLEWVVRIDTWELELNEDGSVAIHERTTIDLEHRLCTEDDRTKFYESGNALINDTVQAYFPHMQCIADPS
jgi:hypothetical protein